MERIVILGPSGAGKSTLARALGPLLDIPVVHLDQINFAPGWVDQGYEPFKEKLAVLVEQPKWIIDGNYINRTTHRFDFADTVIHLDFPRHIYLTRVLKRIITSYGKIRPDSAPGCPERFDWEFLVYVWNFQRASRPKNIKLIESIQADKNIISFSHPRELATWLQSLKKEKNGATL